MKNQIIHILALIVVFFSCEKQAIDIDDPDTQSTITALRDDVAYEAARVSLSEGENSDLFTINSVNIDDEKLIMLIDVTYSGGCEKHDFEMLWPEVITMVYPPNFSVILNHNSNGDMCEANLTEVLEINFKESPLGFDEQSIRDMIVTVINGSNPDEKVANDI